MTAHRETAQVGDAVRHIGDGQTGVVVETLDRNRLVVQTTPGVIRVWYRAHVDLI